MFKKYLTITLWIQAFVLTTLWAQTNKATVFYSSKHSEKQSLLNVEQSVMCDTIDISIPGALEGFKNKIINIPVNVEDSLTNYAINTYQFTLTFDPNVLVLQDIINTTTLTQEWEKPVWEELAAGKVSVGAYGLQTLSCPPSPPPLVYLSFYIKGDPGAETELHFESFSFNISDMNIQTNDGHVKVLSDSDTVIIEVKSNRFGPSHRNQPIEVELKNYVGVFGIQFTIVFNGKLLSCVKVDTTSRSSKLQVASKIWSDSVRVLVFSASGDSIKPEDGSIIKLYVNIDGNAPPGDSTRLQFSQAKISGKSGKRLNVISKEGYIFFGLKGDINNDGSVDIFDVTILVDIILDKYEPTSYEFWAADMDDNGDLDIYDLVQLIDIVLNGKRPRLLPKVAFQSAQVCQIRLPKLELEAGNAADLPIWAAFDGPISGLQLKIRYNSNALKISTPILTDLAKHMNIASSAKNGELTILLYSPTGQTVEAGSEPILKLPVQLLKPSGRGSDLVIDYATVINSIGEKIAVEIASEINSSAVPANFYLAQNYPNPFNAQTWIEYQIPEAGRVILNIFNLIGEEVQRLVDKEMVCGIYKVLWDGKDNQNNLVPSGTYICRLQWQTLVEIKKIIVLQ